MNDLLQGLNASQREAVGHIDGPMLVLAGPGSGKTRVVTHRIANLVRNGVPGYGILALTFTNKAADEMRRRVESLAPNSRVWLGTFHGFAARLLRRYAPLVGLEQNYGILDADESRRVLKHVIARRKADLLHHSIAQVASSISWAKNNLITPEQYTPKQGALLGSLVEKLYPAYCEALQQANSVDFDDLLMHVALLLRDHPEVREELDARYRYILVDEYQDTNLAQYAIARAMSVDHPNLSVTGDPDQSIYGWRGANLQNILDFENDFPNVRVVKLEQNYRSTPEVLHVASQLIACNTRRKHKELHTDNPGGRRVRLANYRDQREEAADIARRIAEQVASGRRRFGDFAIFYRVNALSRTFEFALREHGVPFQLIHALEFYQRKEIKDLRAYLRLLNNPRDDEALLRVINTPRRGIGRTTIDRLAAHADRYALSLLESAMHVREIAEIKQGPRKKVETFVALFDELRAIAEKPVEDILRAILEKTAYDEPYKNSDTEEDNDRLANIEEFITAAANFDERHDGPGRLEAFLEETALASDTDDWESESDRVTLMTMHAAKGLEFPVVHIAAVEEGLLPHERSKGSADQLEEERRLLFVGITRAQEELQLSKATYREFRGQRNMTIPSRFLMELPRHDMELVDQETQRFGLYEDAYADIMDDLEDVHEEAPDEYAHVEATDDEVPFGQELDDGLLFGDDLKADAEFNDERQPGEDDEDFFEEPTENRTNRKRRAKPSLGPLTTAASLHADDASSNGQQFDTGTEVILAIGAIVMHPEHGVGTIVDVSEDEALAHFAATVGHIAIPRAGEGLTILKKNGQ